MTDAQATVRNWLVIAESTAADPGSLVGSFFHGQGDRWDHHQGVALARHVFKPDRQRGQRRLRAASCSGSAAQSGP
jgi:hypothetical protein